MFLAYLGNNEEILLLKKEERGKRKEKRGKKNDHSIITLPPLEQRNIPLLRRGGPLSETKGRGGFFGRVKNQVES